jgi:outer membrane immunogenic protein
MKRVALGAMGMALLGFAASAEAADMYAPRAPYTVNQPLNAYSWAGPYIGGNLGYEWGSVRNNPAKPSGFNGGAQAGYNWQMGNWVFGVEGDIEATAAEDTFAPWKFSNPWFGTLRGRAGYAISNVLFYGTGGLAFGELTGQTFGLSESHTTAGRGWTRAKLERQDRISLCRSRLQPVRHRHQHVERLPLRHVSCRRELSFLIATRRRL